MSEYLSKDEIKKWRSSLEKITLEEFAARLGKKVEQKKTTNDLIDIVLHGQPVISNEEEWASKAERLSAIADRAYEKEKEIYVSSFSAKNILSDDKTKKSESKNNVKQKETNKAPKAAKKVSSADVCALKNAAQDTKTGDSLRDEVRIVFKKALTDREQKVFDYFAQNRNKIVYAKDLAELLDLPRDYVYKYIKNLRAKIDSQALKNADKGGFILTV